MFFKNYIFFSLQTQGHYQNTEHSVSSPKFYFILFYFSLALCFRFLHLAIIIFNAIGQYQPDL